MVVALHHIPVIIFYSLPATFVITLTLGYYYEHITYAVPYISDSGSFPPESCIFGQVLNLFSFLIAFCIYVRYRQVKEIFTRQSCRSHSLNTAGLYVGLLAALGVSLVANFQQTNVFVVHWIGAVLCFGMGALYQAVQTVIYYKFDPLITTKKKNSLRVFLSILSLLTFVIFFCTGMAAYAQFKGHSFYSPGPEVTKWDSKDGGFELHIISTINEWICASCTAMYILLFKEEFKKVTISQPTIYIQSNN